MAIKKVALANRWVSVTDVLDRLRRAEKIGSSRWRCSTHSKGKRSSGGMPSSARLPIFLAQRQQVADRAVSGHRAELKRQSADSRIAYLKTIGKLQDEVSSARPHYQSAVMMLMREGLGSERRSRLIHQIEKSGPVELASLAALAASTGDKELGAALLTRNAGVAHNDRPFSSQELADALVGDDWRKVNQAMAEMERLVLETVHADSAFETGKANATRTIQIALKRRAENAIGADLSDLDDDTDANKED